MIEDTTNTTLATRSLCALTACALLSGCAPERGRPDGSRDAAPDAAADVRRGGDVGEDVGEDAAAVDAGAPDAAPDAPDAPPAPERAFPSARALREGVVPPSPAPTGPLGSPEGAAPEGARAGVLRWTSREARLDPLQDDLGLAGARRVSELPEVTFGWEARGGVVLPERPGLHATAHPVWDVILGEGIRRVEAVDGGAERFVLPLQLVERGQNCTLHGVVTFLLEGDTPTRAYYQFGQETCPYFKADLWGALELEHEPAEVDASAAFEAREARAEAARVEQPLERLAARGVDVEALRRGPTPTHVSARGVVWRGVHYADAPQTRHGPYPLPGSLRLPSYSTAKSSFAALGAMALARQAPEVLDRTLGEALGLAPEHPWAQVTLTHLLDMSTGRYDSDAYMADEGGARMAAFFTAADPAARRAQALGFPAVQAPGERFVYQSSSTYLAAAIMDAHTRQAFGLDLYAWMRQEVYPRWGLRLDEDTTLRDAPGGVPLGGYGLWWRRDELALLAHGLSGQEPTWVDRPAYRRALRRVGAAASPALAAGVGLEYALGFWSTTFGPGDGFGCEVTVPFMSGFGGITVALLPNGAAYYYVSDQYEFAWAEAARELAGLGEVCGR